MRKVVYGGACSLDGFLTGPGGAMDWLHFSKDAQAVMAASWGAMDAMLFGRKTWEVAMESRGGKGGRGGQGGKGGKGGNGGNGGPASYLFSRTLTEAPAGMTLVREDAGGFVRRLKEQPGKDILLMSGGNLARSLFEAGVIDEVGLNVHPVLLGSGTPAFLDAGRIGLVLEECRTLDGGCVLARYRVRH